MLALAGIALVLAAVFGGYVAEKGNPFVLLQPAELFIVCGSAVGIILIANRPSLIRKMAQGATAVFFQPRRTKQSVLRSLRMLYEVFCYAQRAGVMPLEPHVEGPQSSSICSRYPELLRDGATLRFLCDSWRIGAPPPRN